MAVRRGSDTDKSPEDDPLILGPDVLRKPSEQECRPRQPSPAHRTAQLEATFDPKALTIGRMNDNECILFDEPHRLSWIIYPPRSKYDFIHRPTVDSIIIELHPWEPMMESVLHSIRPTEGCASHGAHCIANRALTESVNRGWNPFQ
jgi:hypothetical protein